MKTITVPLEVSARHVHLTAEHVMKLFGHALTPLRPISQTGQFAAAETVCLEIEHRKSLTSERSGGGSRKVISAVRVVGPARSESQVELSLSDCRTLGLTNAPLRVSGSLAGTPGMTLVGPAGKVVLKRGVIVAQRHIHCPTSKAKTLKLTDGQIVRVAVQGKRGVVFDNVVVRVREDFVWRMHLDTDEANAAGIQSGAKGVVIVR